MVWFDEGVIYKILSFSRIWEKYPVCYDTKVKYFYIVKPYKEILFRQILSEIYFHGTSNRILVSRERLYQQQYDDINQERHALAMVGCPS